MKRIVSIDIVRGIVMMLMAIDHVRVYAAIPPGGPSPGVFFTRWITHFVAPAFIFLAGTSAYLHGQKLGNMAELSKFLAVRGAILIALELTLIRIFWTFNFDFGNYILAGVIWVIGWCMILLAVAVHLPVRVVGAIGIGLITLHNLMDFVPWPENPSWLLKVLYYGGGIGPLKILYVIVPWLGVMLAGYAFGRVITMEPDRRRTTVLRLGLAVTAAFLVLRAVDRYGDPRHWRPDPGVLQFLATTKYPASLAFLLMTLGPMLIVLALVDRWRGRVADGISTFGRVPMFYYLLHIPVIHLAACIVSLVREGRVVPWLFGNHPLMPGHPAAGYMWSLGLLYLVTAATLIALYFPCRWYARVRAERRSAWTSYL
ncbi:MAG TPA: heparan-alpha-glucosaminide N-acetyltransferase domain-containing protein [Thermoanaerobaculia bacterium]|nr:heparan-alpha-glucosaminide N-acetyltransferase domain-containing protein [Thermoanaerobaculia bacterium]